MGRDGTTMLTSGSTAAADAADHRPRPGGGRLPADLLALKNRVYDPCGFVWSHPVPEEEGAAYAAHGFTLDGASVRFRVAGTTPTKAGHFVTVWKRSPDGPIRPFDSDDPVDLFVISARDGDRHGAFVFPRAVLREQGIVAGGGSVGKRAFRVYAPWVAPTSRQALRTQAWQVEHFLHIPGKEPVDADRARALHRPPARE
ncbi:MepB family protein [Streptomyces sp. NPDC059165]|uniref:MepB family protein n=1 Tax=Streptomyces sp. NPDC059165 TaxID=3346751 RepID=UPI00369A98EE